MPHNVWPYLLPMLRRALELGADELRFAAGQLPAFKVGTELQSAEEAPVRGEFIQALHEQCLREGKRDDLLHKPIATYEFALPELGLFHCEFQLAGSAHLLRITPEHADALAIPLPPRRGPPASTSAAEPYEPE